MPARSGKQGQVKIANATIEVLTWTLDQKVETFRYGLNGFKRTCVGVKDWTGNFEALGSPPEIGASMNLTLLEGGDGGKTYAGPAIAKQVSVTVTPDTGDIIKYRVDFESDGEWTVT